MNRLNAFIQRHPLLRSLFITQDGKIVIAQTPNATLWGAGLLFIISRFSHPPYQRWVQGGYRGLLISWSIAEIGWGVNVFRRLLGGGVLTTQVASLMRLFR